MGRALPFSKWYHNLLAAAPAFLAGACFDLTSYRLTQDSPLAGSGLFLLLARVLSGAILAGIVLALLRAGRDLTGLGQVGWGQMLVLFLALNVLTAFYVLTSRTVYVWDTAGYWSVARNLSSQPWGISQLLEVLESTVHLDYNYLLAFPISLVMRVLGGSRAVFLFSISNLYTLPALWGLAALGRSRRWGGVVLAGLFPMLVYVGLVGYVDVAACAAAIWALVIYTSDRPGVSRGVFAGALLVGTFLLRRYFFFFAVSFGLAAGLQKLLCARKDWRDFGALFASCAVCGVFFTPNFLLEKVLGTNYGDLYSAYALGLRSDIFLFCRYFGYLVLAAALIWGLCRAILCPAFRPHAVLAFGTLLLCFFLLTRVQSHGQQHTLLYLPSLALLLAPGEEDPKWRRVCAWTLAAVCGLTPLLPRQQPASIAAIQVPDAVPGFTYHGSRRQDVDQLLALSDYLDALAAQDPGLTAAVCASSFLLNNETLTNLRPSLNLPQRPSAARYIYVHDVDKRDSFSWNMLEADYLIVGDPVQVHLGEENQQLIALVAHQVLEGTGVGAAYARLERSFTLQDGSAVYLYRRTREVTGGERAAISAALVERYPDYAELYQAP